MQRGAGRSGATRAARRLAAPRQLVYRALVDADLVALWRFPEGMACEVHAFDPREGGALRISLTYDDTARAGKTAPRTDTYHGRLTRLVPGELVVEVDELETDDPDLQGEMTITIALADAPGGGTDLVALHEGLPPGLSPADNESGWAEALGRLAALVESPQAAGRFRGRTPGEPPGEGTPDEEVRVSSDIWTYRTDAFGSGAIATQTDITGFHVEARDGGIGKIDEATYEVGAGSIVVDTGPWIFGKRVMLPAGTIHRVDAEERKVYVNRTKDQVKNAPEYHDDLTHDEAYRSSLGSYYGIGGAGWYDDPL